MLITEPIFLLRAIDAFQKADVVRGQAVSSRAASQALDGSDWLHEIKFDARGK
jgi:hypothetical protein